MTAEFLNPELLKDRPPAQPEDTCEKQFVDFVLACGFLALNPPSIKCKRKVPDKFGRFRKKVTHPDCLVMDPDIFIRFTYVEVTQGAGNGGGKQAQLSVVKQAESELHTSIPYVVLNVVAQEELYRYQPGTQQARMALMQLLGWIEESI